MMMLVCGGCGSALRLKTRRLPGGGTEPSATAVPEELDSTLEEVRTALQRQCEEGIIRCGYVVDTAEAFLETFELEQWEGPVYPVSLGGGAVLYLQRFAVPFGF